MICSGDDGDGSLGGDYGPVDSAVEPELSRMPYGALKPRNKIAYVVLEHYRNNELLFI